MIANTIRGFDTPDLNRKDTRIRIQQIESAVLGMVTRAHTRITIRPMQSAVREMVRRVNDDVGVGGILLER
jgi:hypothetical protein